uniref:YSIRK-type signal peptide-containing protein n=1 Tax=Gemella sanguinis TaxID=84135 RepID=UPI0028D870BF
MIRKEHQRFSLRKYKVGVASVFLGFGLSFVLAGSGEAKAAETNAETAAPKTEAAAKAETPAATATPKAEAAVTETPAATPAKAEEATPAVTEAKPAAKETAKVEEAAKPEVAEGETKKEEKAEEAKPAAEAKPATEESNKPKVRSRRAVTNEAVTGDHNSNPVAVSTYLKDGEKVTPEIRDANGATVSSQPVPAGYARKEGDWYTYAIWDLTEFNKRYGTKYYARAYKRFDESTDTTVELLDKTTGNVVETRTVTSSSGVQKFTTTTAASNSQLTFQVDYKAGTSADKGKVAQPFIQNGFEVGKSITDLVAAGHQLTPAEQALFTAVYNARTTTDILNVVDPTYNGRTITDSNAKIPEAINKTTYYKVVDKNNPTFNANKTDVTVQDYKENGNEVDLARYSTKAMEGQSFTASGERQFDGYKLYQTADANDKSGYVSRPYKVGTKFMDADRYGIKRIKEVVGEDGSVVVRVYLLDPKQQSKRSDGSLSTDGYMLIAETKPIKPGEWNSQELVTKKSPLNTIAHTVTDPKTGAKTNYPNGKEVPFDFQKASGYAPYHTVFVPFLGDGIGHGSDNAQLERGVTGIGTNVDLLNNLTPYKQPVYYYVKQEPVEVT